MQFKEMATQLKVGMRENKAIELLRFMGRNSESKSNMPDGRWVVQAGCTRLSGLYVVNFVTTAGRDITKCRG
jgi:hypothetical protein